MNGNVISLLANPVSGTDACSRNYVDNSINYLNLGSKYLLHSTASSKYATLTQPNTVNDNATSKLSLSGGVVNGNITMQTGSISLQAGNLILGSTQKYNVNQIACNSGISISSGLARNFLKGDGTTDSNTYALTSVVAGKLNLTGGTLSGPLTIQG